MNDNKYQVGDPFSAVYSNPPIAVEDQYRIGQEIDISDAGTGEILAVFRVTDTDETNVHGVIVRVVA